MDNTKKYIEMCRKATELQELWKPGEADCFLYPKVDHINNYFPHLLCKPQYVADYSDNCVASLSGPSWFIKDCIWLPRQDQLQDLLCEESTIGEVFNCFRKWVVLFWLDRTTFGFSLEKLWLIFAMEMKFHKKFYQWSGELLCL